MVRQAHHERMGNILSSPNPFILSDPHPLILSLSKDASPWAHGSTGSP